MTDYKYLIEVDLQNKLSLKTALNNFRDILEKKDAFIIDGEFSIANFDYSLKNKENLLDSLEPDDGFYKIYQEYLDYSDDEKAPEFLLFYSVLQFEELKEDFIKTSKSIVKYIRKINDSNKFLYDDNQVVGFCALHLLSIRYPKYSYLMGSYIVPNFDESYGSYVLYFLEEYCKNIGFSNETLKIFCYCDNFWMRKRIFPYYEVQYVDGDEKFLDNPIVEYFRKNKEQYELFKKILKERFTESDYLNYGDQFDEHPIDQFYKSLLADEYNDNPDSFSEFFIYDNADVEAEKLEKEIELYIKKPLVNKQGEPVLDSLNEWKEFILNYFKDGEKIWNYIEIGTSFDLNSLDMIDPYKFSEIIKKNSYSLKNSIKKYCHKGDPIINNLNLICEDIFNKSKDKPFLIRFIDFLYGIFGEELLDTEFSSELINRYRLFNKLELYKRYLDKIYIFKKIFKEQQGNFVNLKQKDLENLYNSLLLVRDNQNIKEFFIEINKNVNNRKLSNRVLQYSYILMMDEKNSIDDEITRLTKDFIYKNLTSLFINIIDGNKKLDVSNNDILELSDIVSKEEINIDILMDKLKSILYVEDSRDSYSFSKSRQSKNFFKVLYLLANTEDKNRYQILLKSFFNLAPLDILDSIWGVVQTDYTDFENRLISLNLYDSSFISWRIKETGIHNLQPQILKDLINNKTLLDKVINQLPLEEKLDLSKILENDYKIKTDLNKELNIIIKEFLNNAVLSDGTFLNYYYDFENPIFSGELLDYSGDALKNISYDDETIEEIEEKLNNIKSYEMPTLYIEKNGDDYKCYGDLYLINLYNNRELYEDYHIYGKRVMIVDKIPDFITKKECIEIIFKYLNGEIELKDLEQIRGHILKAPPTNEKFFFHKLLTLLDEEKENRLIKFYLNTGSSLDLQTATSIESLEKFERYLKIHKEMSADYWIFFYKALKDNDNRYLIKLNEYKKLKEYIDEQNLEKKIEILKTIINKNDPLNILSNFKNNKSREIKELINKYYI